MSGTAQLSFDIHAVSRAVKSGVSIRYVSRSCTLSCRLSGTAVIEYGTERLTVRPGDVLCVPPGVSYTHHFDVGERSIVIQLVTPRPILQRITVFPATDPEEICSLFRETFRLWRRGAPGDKWFCLGNVYRLLGIMRFDETDDSPDGALHRAADYINEHLYDIDLSLDEACLAAGISRAYFNRLFKEAYHLTPIGYIRRRRIEKAKYLLFDGTSSNAEIAAACGFREVKYFFSVFKDLTGITPGEYRADPQSVNDTILTSAPGEEG